MNASSKNYASLWRRIAAGIIDNILVSTISFIIIFVLTFALFEGMSLETLGQFFTQPIAQGIDLRNFDLNLGQLFFLVYFPIAFVLTSIVYYQSLFTSSRRASLGMQIFGIKLYRADDKNLGSIRIFTRTILFLIFRLFYLELISFLTILFTARKQSLEDMLCDTVVVSVNRERVTSHAAVL